MHKYILLLTLCLSLVLFINPLATSEETLNESQNTLRVVVNGAPPYRIILQDGGSSVYAGIYIDILKEAARRSGIYLKFQEVPFLRALTKMQTGEADIMLGPLRREERELYMDFLETTLPKEDKVFFIKSEAKDILKYEDLSHLRIGVLAGARYDSDFDLDSSLMKTTTQSYSSALRMVIAGRIDAAIMPERQGDYLLKIAPLNLRKTTLRFKGTESYITFSKSSPAFSLRDRLVIELKKMKHDGRFEAILNKYK